MEKLQLKGISVIRIIVKREFVKIKSKYKKKD